MKAIFVGPEKTGTSWIDEFLRWRGDVALPKQTKETFFFDRHFEQGVDWYLSHFGWDASNCVEVAPSYFKDFDAPQRIASQFERVKIVITLRDPVKRTESMYHHLVTKGWTASSFGHALDSDPWLLSGSRYDTKLKHWRSFFDSKHLFILSFEELEQSPQTYADKIAAILDLEKKEAPLELLSRRVNPRANPRSFLLARVSRTMIYAIRRMGLYRVIEAAKTLGVAKLIWQTQSNPDRLLPEDYAHLAELLQTEMNDLFENEGIDYRSSIQRFVSS